MSKRARLAVNPWLANLAANARPEHGDAGENLRSYVVGKHVSGKMPADELCELAHLVTRAGGVGLEMFDFGVSIAGEERGSQSTGGSGSATCIADDLPVLDPFEREVVINPGRY